MEEKNPRVFLFVFFRLLFNKLSVSSSSSSFKIIKYEMEMCIIIRYFCKKEGWIVTRNCHFGFFLCIVWKIPTTSHTNKEKCWNNFSYFSSSFSQKKKILFEAARSPSRGVFHTYLRDFMNRERNIYSKVLYILRRRAR